MEREGLRNTHAEDSIVYLTHTLSLSIDNISKIPETRKKETEQRIPCPWIIIIKHISIYYVYPSHPICALSILSPNIYITILRCTKDVLYVRITTSLLYTRHTFGYFKVTQLGERKRIIYIKTHTTVVLSLYYIIKNIIYLFKKHTHTFTHSALVHTHTNHKPYLN